MIFPAKYLDASTFTLTSETLTEVTEYGLNYEVAKRGNPHRWNIEFRTIPLDHSNSRGLNAFLNSLDGRYETFTMTSPLPWLSKSTTLTLANNASAGDSQVTVFTGLIAQTDVISAGELIKFENHDKVYEIQEDMNTDNAGRATLKLTPNLFEAVSLNGSVTKAVFTLRLNKDKIALTLDATKLSRPVTITAVENV